MTSHSAWSGAALPATAGPATVAPTGSRPRGYNGCSPYLYNGMLLRLHRPAAAAAARGAAAALRGARRAERSNFTWLRLANVVDEISGGAPIEDLIRCRPCSPGVAHRREQDRLCSQLRRSSAGPGLLGCGGPRGRTAANHCLV